MHTYEKYSVPGLNIDVDVLFCTEDLPKELTSQIVAVDLEMTGCNPAIDQICQMQFFDGKTVYVVSMMNKPIGENIRALFNNVKITKLFFYSFTDLSFLYSRQFSNNINHICLKAYSQIARRYTSSHSLKSVVADFYEVELDKHLTCTNWAGDAKLFNEKKQRYLIHDVVFLIDIYHRFNEMFKPFKCNKYSNVSINEIMSVITHMSKIYGRHGVYPTDYFSTYVKPD